MTDDRKNIRSRLIVIKKSVLGTFFSHIIFIDKNVKRNTKLSFWVIQVGFVINKGEEIRLKQSQISIASDTGFLPKKSDIFFIFP